MVLKMCIERPIDFNLTIYVKQSPPPHVGSATLGSAITSLSKDLNEMKQFVANKQL